MIQTRLPDFKKHASRGNVVAVTATIPADLETPVSTFLKLANKLPHAFLFESAEQGEKVGRYSIIGFNPAMVLSLQDGKTVRVSEGRKSVLKTKDILSVLKQEMSHLKLANPGDIEGFPGGFVGFLGYENVSCFEDVKLKARKSRKFPDSIFFLTREMVIFDHFRKNLKIVSLVYLTKKSAVSAEYARAVKRIKSLISLFKKTIPVAVEGKSERKLTLKSNTSKKSFENKVKRIKEYIRAGDCIQVVLSQYFSFSGAKDDFKIYRALRSINPSPYMFYFRSGDFRLIGSSPELLVKKTGKTAEVRPIAGTRPRGRDNAEDLRYEDSLRKSPKETAEHLMLVDLGRNDLGRVCRFNSVTVQDYARVERYSHVMHLVSDVAGKLRPGMDAFDLLRATFPAGTVSGAPKIRAMEIIDELEAENRGPYAGCVDYFGFDQKKDMCITIRTLVSHRDKIYIQAGAGIVKDSNPAKEYQECLNKAKAVMHALEMRDGF